MEKSIQDLLRRHFSSWAIVLTELLEKPATAITTLLFLKVGKELIFFNDVGSVGRQSQTAGIKPHRPILPLRNPQAQWTQYQQGVKPLSPLYQWPVPSNVAFYDKLGYICNQFTMMNRPILLVDTHFCF